MKRLPVVPAQPLPLAEFSPLPTDTPALPSWPHQPTVEWQVCGQCNYDCSYCIQSKKHRVGYPSEALLDSALHFLCNLEGSWEIKMTGGEPFVSSLFLRKIVPALAKSRHTISVLTNLSAPPSQLAQFAELTRGKLQVLSASLHLESAGATQFLSKLTTLRAQLDGSVRIVVNCVLAPQHLDAVAEAKREVEGAGFRFFPQLMKVKHGLYPYDEAEQSKVAQIIGAFAIARELRSANLAPDYRGRLCYTGVRYFVLLQNGDAYSCRSARRYGQGYLGNVMNQTLRLATGPVRCPYPLCPCSVPANRGMIEGIAAHGIQSGVGEEA